MVVVVRGVLLRLDGWWLLGCFVVSVVVVNCCFGGCSWYMRLVDALWNRDANAGERNIHLEGRRTMAIYSLDGQ